MIELLAPQTAALVLGVVLTACGALLWRAGDDASKHVGAVAPQKTQVQTQKRAVRLAEQRRAEPTAKSEVPIVAERSPDASRAATAVASRRVLSHTRPVRVVYLPDGSVKNESDI